MSSLISIRLQDEIFNTMKAKAAHLHLSQTEYIRTAIERMNHETEQLERTQRLRQASLRVRKESMEINAEFSKVEHDPED